MPSVILTRPLADSRALAAELAAYGIECILSPVMEIRPLSVTLPVMDGLEGLIVTSRHALPACLPLKHLPLYAVGEHTAQTARDSGFTVAAQAETAEALLPLIPPAKPLVYASGETVRLDFTAHLPHVRRVVTYRAESAAGLSKETVAAITSGTASGVAFYSPRAAEIFSGMLQDAGLSGSCATLTAFCLSGAIAQCCTRLGWSDIRTAAAPTQAAMISLLANIK